MDTSELLSRTAFSILLALSLKPRHGYELMQQVEHDTAGRVRLGPGALYGTVKQLVDARLIEEMPFEGTERRRYYRLTRKGWDRLGAEMQYYEQTVRLGHERQVLPADKGTFAWTTN